MLLCTTARVTMPHLPSQHCTPHHPCSHQPTFYANIFVNIMQKILELCSQISTLLRKMIMFSVAAFAQNEFEFCLAVPLLLCPSNLKCLLSRVFKTHLHKTGGGRVAADWHRFDTCNAILQCTVCRHAAANTGTGTGTCCMLMYNVTSHI